MLHDYDSPQIIYELLSFIELNMYFSWLQHADMVMIAMIGLSISLAVIPLKLLLMVGTLYLFSKTSKLGKRMGSYQDQGSRRLKEWWESIPIIPVRVVDKPTSS